LYFIVQPITAASAETTPATIPMMAPRLRPDAALVLAVWFVFEVSLPEVPPDELDPVSVDAGLG
jgi:hypothetical protein